MGIHVEIHQFTVMPTDFAGHINVPGANYRGSIQYQFLHKNSLNYLLHQRYTPNVMTISSY